MTSRERNYVKVTNFIYSNLSAITGGADGYAVTGTCRSTTSTIGSTTSRFAAATRSTVRLGPEAAAPNGLCLPWTASRRLGH